MYCAILEPIHTLLPMKQTKSYTILCCPVYQNGFVMRNLQLPNYESTMKQKETNSMKFSQDMFKEVTWLTNILGTVTSSAEDVIGKVWRQ